MERAIDRIMTTFRMMVHLTPDQEREARERVERYLRGKGTDEHILVVAGLTYLRGRGTKRRRASASVENRVE